MTETRQGQIKRGRRRRYRWLVFLLGLGAVGAMGVLAAFYWMTEIGQWALNTYLDRTGLQATTAVKIEHLGLSSLRVGPLSYRDPELGVEVDLEQVEVDYRLVDLWHRRGAATLRIGPGEIDIDIDTLMRLRDDQSAADPTDDTGLMIPPLAHLQGTDLVLRTHHGDAEVEAGVWFQGERDGDGWAQRAAVAVKEWDGEVFMEGFLSGSNSLRWDLSGSGRLGEPLTALDAALPRWREMLPEGLQVEPGVVHFQGEATGAGGSPQQSMVLVETDPGSLTWREGKVHWEGWVGAAFFPELDPLRGEVRLHGRLSSMSWSELFETRAMAVELNRDATGRVAGNVGPWAARTGWGEMEGALNFTTTWDGSEPPTEMDLELDLLRLRPVSAVLEGEGNGELTLRAERLATGWSGRSNVLLEFPRISRAGLILETVLSEATLQVLSDEMDSAAPSDEDGNPASLFAVQAAIAIQSDRGRYGETFLDKVRLSSEVEGLVAPDSLLPLVTEGGDAAAAWWDWFALLMDKQRMPWFGSVHGSVGSAVEPGRYGMEGAEIVLTRSWHGSDGSPALGLNVEVASGNWGSARFTQNRVEARIEADRGEAAVTAQTAGGMPLALSFNYDRRAETGGEGTRWEAQLDPLDLAGSGLAGMLGGVWTGSKLGGVVSGSAAGALTRDGAWDGRGGLGVKNLSIKSAEQDLEAEGVGLELVLASLNPLTSETGQTLQVNRLRKGKLNGSNLRVRFKLESAQEVAVSQMRFEAFGGEIRLSPFRWNFASQTMQTTLTLRNIDAAEVMKLTEDFPGELTGRLHGQIWLGWNGRDLTFGRGTLELAEGVGAVLRLNLDRRPIDPDAPAYDFLSNLAQTQTAVESLRQVKVQELRVDLFNPDRPQNPNQLRLKGTSLSIRPSAPLDLTVNLQGDVQEALRHFIRFLLGTG